MRNMIIFTITMIAIILLAGCANKSSGDVMELPTLNTSVTQTTSPNVSNVSTTTGSNISNTTTPVPNVSVTACSNKECFVSAANNCSNETIQLTENYGVVKYSTANCILTKTVISLGQSESADIKRLVEGKNMTCIYAKGNFDQDWINSLVLGVEKCKGGLKDAITDLLVFS